MLLLLCTLVAAQQNMRIVFKPLEFGSITSKSGNPFDQLINSLFNDDNNSMSMSSFSSILSPPTQVADVSKSLDDIMSAVSGMDIGGLKLVNRATVPDNCTSDAKLYCPADNKSLHCLAQHHAQLKPLCIESVKFTVPFICSEMITLHCDGLDVGILECLNNKKEQLHPPCRDALEATNTVLDKINNSAEVHLVRKDGQVVHTLKSFLPNSGGSWFPSFSALGFLIMVIAVVLIWRQHEIIRQNVQAASQQRKRDYAQQQCELSTNEYGAI